MLLLAREALTDGVLASVTSVHAGRHAHATAASFLQPGTWTEAVLHDHGADAFAALWAGVPDPGATGHNFIAIDGDGRAAWEVDG